MENGISWSVKRAQELSVPLFHDILKLRSEVFVVEQECAYLDIDGKDLGFDTRHLIAQDIGGRIMAYARIFNDGAVHIGRVIVIPEARKLKLGTQLVDKAIDTCNTEWPQETIKIEAQAHLQEFYGRMGFKRPEGAKAYLEDGIEHISMELEPKNPTQ